MRESVTSRPIEDLFGANVPYPGERQINLLKVNDMKQEDIAKLREKGYSDVLKGPSANILQDLNHIDLEKERNDQLTKSTITFQFVGFKTPKRANLENIPKRFYFVLRFFTFCEVVTDYQNLVVDQEDMTQGGLVLMQAKKMYFLKKQSAQAIDPNNKAASMVSVTYKVDPDKSEIVDEHYKLAKYLKERYLTIDIFDGDSKFFYGSCKVPLFEICRQGRGSIAKPKECEIFNPDGEGDGKENGFLQLVMSNQGDISTRLPEAAKAGK